MNQLLTASSEFSIEELLDEFNRRQGIANDRLLSVLFPDEDTALPAPEHRSWPYTHKMFDGYDTIFCKNKYIKALEFWAAGKDHQQRFLMAGNRVGKSLAAAVEVSYHLTGLYPADWNGVRFNHPTQWWICGDSRQTIISTLQPLFLGDVGDFGHGLIPKDCIDFSTLKDAQKAATSVGMVKIMHTSGAHSSITFKSYFEGRKSFQGAAVCVMLDEEPPQDVYGECLLRTATGDNILVASFTPLSGETELIKQLLPDGDYYKEGDLGKGKYLVRLAMDDAPHLDEQKIENILSGFPEYQRKARRLGIPTLSGGAIFPYDVEKWTIDPIALPEHWPRAFGFDIGQRTATVWFAHDRDSNIYYAYTHYYEENALPSAHIAAIQARGKWIKGAIDTAAHADGVTDQQNLFKIYEDAGLDIVNATKSVEAGIFLIQSLLNEGRLKVFKTEKTLISQLQNYRRDSKGKIIKKGDDLVDAFRYALMTPDIFQTSAEANRTPYSGAVSSQYRKGTGRQPW